MKNVNYLVSFLIVSMIVLQSCSFLFYPEKSPVYATDLVCGMKVNKTDAYVWRYKGSKYYFDNYNCKAIFKMNPEKFLNNKCVNPGDSIAQK